MNKKDIRFVGIDPSSKTGFVILDSMGEVVIAEELKSKNKDPLRMIDITKEIRAELKPTDKIGIEGFAFGAKGRALDFQYGLGWLIRVMMYVDKISYSDITPSQLKKFASNRGNAKKDDLVLPIYKKWGFEHSSDNVRDAYVLARMVYSMYNHEGLVGYEQDVLKKIIKP